MESTKAVVTQIEYAGLSFEGLMLPSGEYAVTLKQFSDIFLESQNPSAKRLKVKTGIDFKTRKLPTETNRKPSVIISLEDMGLMIQVLAQKGNQQAIAFAVASITEKLERIFDAAFGKEVTEREREVRFNERLFHKKQYHPCLTIWFKTDGVEGQEYGVRMNAFKRAAQCPIKSVDQYDAEELHRLNNAEVTYDTLRKAGMGHIQAIAGVAKTEPVNIYGGQKYEYGGK